MHSLLVIVLLLTSCRVRSHSSFHSHSSSHSHSHHHHTCNKPVSMVETGLSDKNKYLFAFSQKGLPFNHINVNAGLKLEGQSVDLVLEVCAFAGICCDVLVVHPTNCWDNSLFPGFSPGLNEMFYDFCADIDFDTNKNLSYAFSTQPYRAGLADLRLMVRKDSRALAGLWDKALTHYMCSDQYEDFCDYLSNKYNTDADCVDVSTLDCKSLGKHGKFGHFRQVEKYVR